MACLNKEVGKYYRIHWKFKVTAGPKTGQTFEGSVYLGRCTHAAAKAPMREIETWEEAIKTGRHLPEGESEEIYRLWLREKHLSCTPQSVQRAERVVLSILKMTSELIETGQRLMICRRRRGICDQLRRNLPLPGLVSANCDLLRRGKPRGVAPPATSHAILGRSGD